MSLLTLAAEKHRKTWRGINPERNHRTFKQLKPSRQSTLRAKHDPITNAAHSSVFGAMHRRNFTVTL